jgi:putative hydrolase of the HAD superfamily
MNIVFDFGAVLFNWRPLELVAQVFPEMADTQQSAKDFAQSVFAHPDWMDFDRGLVDRHRISELIAQRLSLDPLRVTALVNSVEEQLYPLPDSLAILCALHAQRQVPGSPVSGLYFLSNMSVPFSRGLEQTHDFLGWFDGGIFSGDVQRIKPEPAIYELLQARYALSPANIIFIDDMPYNVEAAKALGWNAYQFTSAGQLRLDLASFLPDEFALESRLLP